MVDTIKINKRFNMQTLYNGILVVLAALLLVACREDTLDVDLSGIEVDINIERFDKALFSFDIGNPDKSISELQQSYGKFFDLYNKRIISIGGAEEKGYSEYLTLFTNTYNDVYNECQSEFADMEQIEKELEDGFSHYRYYFPEKVVPKVLTHISGFNEAIVIDDSLISISLDKFLGSSCDFYEQLGLPVYLRKRMQKRYIAVEAVKAWLESEFPMEGANNNLAGYMIYKGKILYLTDAMYPQMADSLKNGYSNLEIEWCTRNERTMWSNLIENKLLFTTDYMEIKRYVDNAPFTASFTKDSPGRAGEWIGWQIVRAYMKENSNVSVSDLAAESDYLKILNNSRYDP